MVNNRIALDCIKARKELGWSPKLSLREGIAQAAEYYRKLARASTVK
jgi:nucleoside-diphosphate-sugar epimerase